MVEETINETRQEMVGDRREMMKAGRYLERRQTATQHHHISWKQQDEGRKRSRREAGGRDRISLVTYGRGNQQVVCNKF
jgi:hypothetical protein